MTEEYPVRIQSGISKSLVLFLLLTVLPSFSIELFISKPSLHQHKQVNDLRSVSIKVKSILYF